MPASPLLLAVDGDSLVHRAYHAMGDSEHRDSSGGAVWALRGLVTLIAGAAARLRPDAVVVGFDSRATLDRKRAYPEYKAHRPVKAVDLLAQLEQAPGLLEAAGFPVVVADGAEADDVLASAASLARATGWRSTLMTSDRDSFALLDEATSVLWLRGGGVVSSPVLTAETLPEICGVRPDQYRDYAALRGDVSDNLPGALGIGAITAARLLCAFGDLDAVFAALDEGRGDVVEAVIGTPATARLAGEVSRANLERNRRLMVMDPALAMPVLDAMRLPLDGERVRSALRARDIRLGPSLWALVGEPMPPWFETDGAGARGGLDGAAAHVVVLEPRWRAVSRWRPVPISADQLALF
ncbi:MAG: 5'-3' exonuclease H3TH domain-containing protein [Kineosporiaceae bacterium]|jgi:DNA polymerase-1